MNSLDDKAAGAVKESSELMMKLDIPWVKAIGYHPLTEEDKKMGYKWLVELIRGNEEREAVKRARLGPKAY